MLCGIIALKLIWLYNGWHEYVLLPPYQISTLRKSTDSSCHILLTLVSFVLFSLSLSRSPASVEDFETGYTGSLPDQLGILHLSLLSLASVEDSETGYAGSLPDQLGILHLYLLSPASMEDSETGYAGSLPDQLGILHILSFYASI